MKETRLPFEKNKNMKFLFCGLIAAVLAVLSICSFFVYQLNEVTVRETRRYLTELSNSVADSVNARLDANLDALESLSHTYVGRKKHSPVELDFYQKKAEIQNFLRIYIMAPDGSAVGTDGTFADFSGIPEIMEVLEGKRIVVKGNASYTGNEDGFAYAVPIYEGDQITGAMVAANTVQWINGLLDQDYFGGSGFFHIIKPDGTLVVKSHNPNSLMEGRNYFVGLDKNTAYGYGTSPEQMKQRLEAGEEGFLYFDREEDCGSKIVKYVPLEQPGLYLLFIVTEEAAAQQFDMLRRQAVLTNALITALFLALVLILYVIYNRSNRKLSQLAFVDPITGGYSQSRFELEAEKQIRSALPGTYTFVTINISRFKLINDAFGAAQGDRTLKHVHDTIQRHLREGELLCRSTSDHFDVLLKTCPQKEILETLRQITMEINRFNDMEKNKYFLSLTIGVCQVDEPLQPIVYIRDRANVARKDRTMALGGHLFSCVFYSDVERQKQQHEKSMENRMDAALEAGEFVVYLQPKVELEQKRIVAAEALVRWQDPKLGLVFPDEFIPFFEKNGFIVQLDLYVFEQACQMLQRWIADGISPIPISVNLSRVHLAEEAFLDKFIAVCGRYGISPGLLEIELTETMVFENPDVVLRVIEQIHRAGFLCSLDDFGSGYSSLNLLKDIKVDVLKLDKAFFKSMETDNLRERAIIESVVDMARKLGMRTVSEGVETMEQFEFLRKIHCDMVQGYVISKPVPIGEFERLAFGERERPKI